MSSFDIEECEIRDSWVSRQSEMTTHIHNDYRERNSPRIKRGDFLLAILATIIITFLFIGKAPLHDVHWDAPIYLLRGKIAAETSILQSYRQHAPEIVNSLPAYRANIGDQTPYWGFTRLGNTLLLGAIHRTIIPGIPALSLSTIIYVMMLAGTVAMAALLAIRIIEATANVPQAGALRQAAWLSAAIYSVSDIARHLAGNFVSEIPATLFLSTGVLALVEAVSTRSLVLAALSGVAAFAVYATKMDLVWGYVSFYIIFLIERGRSTLLLHTWHIFAIAALIGIFLFFAYAWYFYPLADPRNLLIFASAHRGGASPAVSPMGVYVAAGGLLWVGLLLSLLNGPRESAWWIALAWIVSMTVPYFAQLAGGGGLQARMCAGIMVPLMILSTIGWSRVFQRDQETTAIRSSSLLKLALVSVVVLILISHEESYQKISRLPGAWRLQYVKEFTSPPRYERRYYQVEELASIGNYLRSRGRPAIVGLGQGVTSEHAQIITYFGERDFRSEIFDRRGVVIADCDVEAMKLLVRSIMFCEKISLTDDFLNSFDGIDFFTLKVNDKNMDGPTSLNGAEVFGTKSLLLSKFN